MTIAGGSDVLHPANVINLLNGMKLPEEAPSEPILTPGPSEKTPIAGILEGERSLSPGQNVAEAESTAVELPNFIEEEPAPPELEEPAANDDLESDLPDSPAAENFKKLRTVVKTERQAKKELESKLKETATKLEAYEKGEVVPDVMRKKDERISELEKYEKIVNLKMSPEYQESFVQPALALRHELEKIGEDYGIPPHVVLQAVEITNRKELNSFLSQHFDDVGGLEVKRIVGELQDLGERALEADKAPQEALLSLKAQFQERQAEEKQARASTFQSIAKDGWQKALEKTKTEGVYRELVLHPTDNEFNKKVVEPIQHRASVQYGALVKKLSDNGLKVLPPDLAQGLARMVLLSIGGALTMDAKVKAEDRANAVIQNTKRTVGYMRPAIGGQNGSTNGGNSSGFTGPTNPRSAAEEAVKNLNKMLTGR